ncbi:hypothetical protein BIFGAL_04168 [Bifidobacterium gallicum DSM 20093 = LMG 11596]|uniref:Uncharacterized protein n=1 Tax=Bifidobacterium gallicum DSM 20093 = LMG 11596 TaxID=561180 RepID=D1NWB9_9BIFI|nr:hypothetical protein BIFGAL_04168 [Bifidobacterium gallicum DSM 20093 = LMG 11596]
MIGIYGCRTHRSIPVASLGPEPPDCVLDVDLAPITQNTAVRAPRYAPYTQRISQRWNVA